MVMMRVVVVMPSVVVMMGVVVMSVVMPSMVMMSRSCVQVFVLVQALGHSGDDQAEQDKEGDPRDHFEM
jgi:hypothetical protein